jgi:uncharacterized RDD family membrane protein YckC
MQQMSKNISTKPNFWKRFFAGLIDYLIIFIFAFLIFDIWGEKDPDGITRVHGLPAFCLTLVWFFFTVCLEQFFGATLGNSIFNLKPISIRENKLELTFGQSLKRHLLDMVDFSPIGLGIMLIKKSNNNQRLGDIWAETVVIDITDPNQSIKKFDNIQLPINDNIQKNNIVNYFVKRALSALIDFMIFVIAMKILESYIGNKIDGQYYTNTIPTIIAFFFYLLIQDVLFRKTLGKRIFKLELKLLENENSIVSNYYFRIITRRVFDLIEMVCPFIYIISIALTDKNQKIGDKLTRIMIIESKQK